MCKSTTETINKILLEKLAKRVRLTKIHPVQWTLSVRRWGSSGNGSSRIGRIFQSNNFVPGRGSQS